MRTPSVQKTDRYGRQNASAPGAVPDRFDRPPPALHRYAILCVAATLCLIFIGGLVTSTGSALAVPDWPLAFGRLVPKLEGGVRFEYGHRLAAGIVAILTLGLTIWTWRRERRQWVRMMTLAASALVLFQAGLGGITVLLRLPLLIAVMHAATAQAFFGLLVAIAAVMNPRWAAPRDQAYPSGVRSRAIVLTAVIYIQILIGAVMRHLGAGLAIPDFPLSYGRLVPPLDSAFVAINFVHRCGAVVVGLLIVWTAIGVFRVSPPEPRLRRVAAALMLLLALQLTLGAITVWSRRAVLPATAHVAIGAAILATSLLLTVRLYAPGPSIAPEEPARLQPQRSHAEAPG